MGATIPVRINLSFKQLIEVVKKLPPAEKSLLNDILWDESMPVPSEHESLVSGRIKKAKENPERLLDWESASKTLRS